MLLLHRETGSRVVWCYGSLPSPSYPSSPPPPLLLPWWPSGSLQVASLGDEGGWKLKFRSLLSCTGVFRRAGHQSSNKLLWALLKFLLVEDALWRPLFVSSWDLRRGAHISEWYKQRSRSINLKCIHSQGAAYGFESRKSNFKINFKSNRELQVTMQQQRGPLT